MENNDIVLDKLTNSMNKLGTEKVDSIMSSVVETSELSEEETQNIENLNKARVDAAIGTNPGQIIDPRTFRKTRPIVREHAKVGRNEPCPCGSGKKYKKCCWNEGTYEGHKESEKSKR